MTEEFLNDEQTALGSAELVIGDRTIPIEEACTYKTVETSKMVMRLLGLIDMDEIFPKIVLAQQSGGQTAVMVMLVQKLLPMLANDMPDTLLDLAALVMTPNSEMMKLYRKPNGISSLIKDNKEWLLFSAPPEASIQIITEFFPHLGLKRLKNVWNPLIATMSGVLGITKTVEDSSAS